MQGKKLLAADLFCGAGGTSQGLLMAANEMGADLELVAVNHWQIAIDTHSVNHPYAKHVCTGIDAVDPRKLVPGGRLNVLCASPECTHHSVARGGKPMSDQSRSSAWHILRFCEALYIENLVIENVPEFLSWGPLGANGRPLKSKRGELFEQFINSLKALGYNVDWRVLNCADYGDPTTRRRLFVVARRGGKKVRWPEPTHVPASQFSQGAQSGLFEEVRKPWRTAREIIDWSLPSQSIFERKKPLAAKTLKRIEAGLKKFCGIDVDLQRCISEDLRPFLVILRGTATTADVDDPLNTVTASGNHYGLVEPFLTQWDQQSGGDKGRSIDEPIPTVVTKANTGVVEPFLVQAGGPEGQGRQPSSINAPFRTVLVENRTALVEPFVIGHPREKASIDSIDKPLGTVTATSCDMSIVEPFLTAFRGDYEGREDGSSRHASLNDPLPTQDTSNRFGLVDPFMVTVNHAENGGTVRGALSVDEPMPTTTVKIGNGVCQPFLIAYYGTTNISEAGEPVPSVTTKPRFGLVEPEVSQEAKYYRLDIRFRMLQPRELARAQGFPDTYKFTGNREAVVKQIGNAVPPNTAKALILEALGARAA